MRNLKMNGQGILKILWEKRGGVCVWGGEGGGWGGGGGGVTESPSPVHVWLKGLPA